MRILSFLSISLLLFPSCFYQRSSTELFTASSSIRLCLEMPQNKFVFENMSSMVYDALWNHFERVGYKLIENREDCFVLKVTIADSSSVHKFVSADLLRYATKEQVTLLCELFDEDDVLLAKKTFICRAFVPRAKEYVENSSFSDFEYRRLFDRYAPKIDYYFRPYLLKKIKQKP